MMNQERIELSTEISSSRLTLGHQAPLVLQSTDKTNKQTDLIFK